MKINLELDKDLPETEVHIKCSSISESLKDFIAQLCLMDYTIVGYIKNEAFFIPLHEILYFEAVDGRVFFYTENNYYQSATRLYMLEEKLQNTSFTRISKTAIANLKKITSIKKAENSRLVATLINGEKVVVSRGYVSEIRKRLGV